VTNILDTGLAPWFVIVKNDFPLAYQFSILTPISSSYKFTAEKRLHTLYVLKVRFLFISSVFLRGSNFSHFVFHEFLKLILPYYATSAKTYTKLNFYSQSLKHSERKQQNQSESLRAVVSSCALSKSPNCLQACFSAENSSAKINYTLLTQCCAQFQRI